MRIIKILLSLVVILVAITIAAPFFLEPNDFKEEIASAVENATGRKLDINGDLDISVFPWLGLKTGKLSLGNRAGFEEKSFATIESAQIRVKLIPLFSSKIEMDSLQLNGLALNLQQLKNGKNNWSDLSAKSDNSSNKKPEPSDPPKIAALAIGGIEIKDSNIRFRDALSSQDLKLTQLNLQTGPLELGAPVDISLSTHVSAQQPNINGSFEITTEFKANPFDGTYQLNNSQIVVNLKGKTLPAGHLKGTLKASIAANLITQKLNLSKLTAVSDPLTITGDMNISKIFATNPKFSGEISVAEFSPKKLLNKFKIAIPTMADSKALDRASFNTNINGSLQKINFNKLNLVLDDSLIQGDVSLLNKKRKSISYNIVLDQIDLDRYLPPAATQTTNFSIIPIAIAAPTPAALFPVDLFRSFDMSGNIKAGQLIMNRLKIENIDIKINQQRGFLKIEPIKGLAYEGNYLGHIRIDARKKNGNTPLISANENLSNVSIGPVIQIITGKESLTGKGNISAVITSRGQSISALKQALNGEIKISLANGVLKGIDVVKMVQDTYAKYKNIKSSADSGKDETPFTDLSVSFQIRNGIMNSQDLVITSALPLVRGKGSINLNNNTLDYTLKTSADAKLVELVGMDKKLTGVPLRINLNGNLASPAYSVDWVRIVGRVLEKTQKKKLLDSLFGKKKKKKTSPATTSPATQAAPVKPETAAEKKKRKKREKKEKIKNLLKGLF